MKSVFYSLIVVFLVCAGASAKAEGYYYKLKIYHLKSQAQADRLDAYLKNAYLPAMHKLGVKNMGVFKPIKADTAGMLVYVFVPFKTINQLESLEQKLLADQDYVAAGKDYLTASYKDAPYTRLETIVLSAFPKMPESAVPNLTANKTDRVYELRNYESATEAYNINKVNMFNDGDEVALFKRLGFNAIFYSEVLSGSHMPNLMYMISFDSMEEHDKHWKAFGDDAYWKTLSAKTEYQNNVSHIDAIFMHPTAYSDF